MGTKISRKYVSELFPVGFLLLFSIALFYPVIIHDKTFFSYTDNSEQFYAWYQKLSIAIHHGYFPLWNANVYGGHCFAGEFQTAIFYPLNLIWVVFWGSEKGINIYYLEWLVILHFFIASLGMYYVLKTFRLSSLVSIVGGLFFAYTGCVAARALGQTAIFFGLALTPFTFLFLLKAIFYNVVNCKKEKIFLMLTGSFIGLQILAGHIQPAFHSILLTTTFFLYSSYSKYDNFFTLAFRVINRLKYIIASMFVIASPQLYLGFRYMRNAYRWVSADAPISNNDKIPFDVFSNKFILNPNQIINLITRKSSEITDGNDIYIGLLPLFFIILYVVLKQVYKQHDFFNQYKYFFIAVLLVSFVIMLGGNTFVPILLYKLPGFTMVRQLGRYAILFHFALISILSFALHYVLELTIDFSIWAKRIAMFSLIVLGSTLLCFQKWLTYILFEDVLINLYGVLIVTFIYLLLSNYKYIRSIAISLCFITVLFLTSSSSYTNKNSPYYPLEYFKINKFYNYLIPLYGTTRVIIDTDKFPKNIGNIYPIQTKLGYSATMNKNYFDFICQDWSLNSKVNDVLNIKYIITEDSLNLPIIMKDDSLKLKMYFRPTALNRLFLLSDVNVSKSIVNKNRFTYKKIAYSDISQLYETETLNADTLVFSENYYFGWNAYVDGQRVELLTPSVSGLMPLLMAIQIPKGKHKIELKYNSLF